MWYKLDADHNVVPTSSHEVNEWLGRDKERRVDRHKVGGVIVSTVFLCLDHAFGGGPPVVFETLVSGGEHDQHMERYCTWAEAEDGHARIVEMVSVSNNGLPVRALDI